MNTKYLAIKRLRVQHANSMMSYNTIGAPPITAHLGFAGAIAHRFNIECKGVAILHHGQDHEGMYIYGRLAPNRVRGVPPQLSSKKLSSMALSDQPFAISHYEASLIIAFEAEDFEDLESSVFQNSFINMLLSKFRLAGGVIVNVGGVAIFEDLGQANRYLPKAGHWVLDRKDILEKENRKEGESVLVTAIHSLYPIETDPKENGLDKPWLSMSVVGYVRLTDFEKRDGVRQDLPHAFVEPMLGMIEYKSIRKIPSIDEEMVFWKFVQLTEDSYIAIAQSL